MKIDRRSFLKSAAALAAGVPAWGADRVLTYVGTYSNPKGPEGSKGNGKGIYLFEMNPATGALTPRELFANDANPAWLAFNPSRTHLYSANEIDNYQGASASSVSAGSVGAGPVGAGSVGAGAGLVGGGSVGAGSVSAGAGLVGAGSVGAGSVGAGAGLVGAGSVSAYSIDRSSGRLTLLNTVSSQGAGPAHLSLHPSGKFVLVANYAGGTVAVLPLQPNGSLGDATDVKRDTGPVGPARAATMPQGGFAISGHDKPHAHMIQSDPSGRFVVAADLGMDQLLIWKFDLQKGTLTPNDPPSLAVPPGDGPRHFAFHPTGRWMYSLQEEASTLITFDYDAAQGRLTAKQTISSLPKGFRGTDFTSEVMISADGKFLYAANRLHDSIAWFSIAPAGTLTFAGEEWTRGDYPRSFNIDPSGTFLYSCNQRADAIATFRVNRKTGALTFTGQYTDVGTPAAIIFLT